MSHYQQSGYACESCEFVIEVVGHEVEGPICPNCGEIMRWNHDSGDGYY